MEWLERWFKIKPESIDKAVGRLQGKGALMGFFGFLPAVENLVLVALGFMRANTTMVMISMTIGKLLRYILIGYGTGEIIKWF